MKLISNPALFLCFIGVSACGGLPTSQLNQNAQQNTDGRINIPRFLTTATTLEDGTFQITTGSESEAPYRAYQSVVHRVNFTPLGVTAPTALQTSGIVNMSGAIRASNSIDPSDVIIGISELRFDFTNPSKNITGSARNFAGYRQTCLSFQSCTLERVRDVSGDLKLTGAVTSNDGAFTLNSTGSLVSTVGTVTTVTNVNKTFNSGRLANYNAGREFRATIDEKNIILPTNVITDSITTQSDTAYDIKGVWK